MGATGFDYLAQAGAQNARAQSQRKQQLTDQERETKLNDHNQTIQTIQGNMTAAQQAGDKDALARYQTQLDQVVADRTALFHPNQGPGAMAHLGKMVWEHVHGKTPAPSTQASTPEFQVPGAMGGAGMTSPAFTGPVVTQRPQTPADLKARAATDLSYGAPAPAPNKFTQQRQQLKEGGFSDEQIEKAMGIFAGIEPKPVADKPDTKVPWGKPIKGADGKWVQPMRNKAGEITNEPTPEGYEPPVAPAHMTTYAQNRADYAKSKGYTSVDEMTFQDDQDMMASMKQASTPTTSGSSQSLVYDQNNDPHIFTKKTSSSKTFPGATTTAKTPPPTGGTATAASPADLKKRVPKGNGGSSSQFGPAMTDLHKATPTENKAAADVLAATKLDSLANQALASHEPVQQRQLALGLIRGMAGRVNMQEFQQYTTKMGVANTVEGLINGITSGQMPEGIVQQLVNAAHANLKAAKEAQAAARTHAPDVATPQTGAASNMPPQSVIDTMREGQYVHGSDGSSWRKVNGVPVLQGGAK